ncbi:selenium binding protein [Oceanobacillus oncorhynchi]|uniref:selenium binding protein n=1 Tax=Oceanobacillus oncorhynchi TaxID=545501 RepID=UPI0034D4D485
MYEEYSKQALPNRKYRELLGSAMCVFNSNNNFIIENILNNDNKNKYKWSNLIGYTSGELSRPIKQTITRTSGTDVAIKFFEIIEMRNRIFHSYQVTRNDEQVLSTRTSRGKQFLIDEDYLYEFIKKNEELSDMLYDLR